MAEKSYFRMQLDSAIQETEKLSQKIRLCPQVHTVSQFSVQVVPYNYLGRHTDSSYNAYSSNHEKDTRVL